MVASVVITKTFLRRRLFVRIARIIYSKKKVFVILGDDATQTRIDQDNSKKRSRFGQRSPMVAGDRLSLDGGTAGEPVDGVRGGAGGRACALRAARGRGRAGFEVRAAGDGVRRARPGRPDPAARPDRRALGVVHRAGAGEGERPASRGGVHVGDGGGELPSGRHRGRRVGDPAAAAHRRPAAGTARHRGQPDRRPDQAVRLSGSLVRRVRRPRAAPRDGRLLALTGLPRLGPRGRRPRRPPRPGARAPPPGPPPLNPPLRAPLVPDAQPPTSPSGADWPDSLEGRADGAPWTRTAGRALVAEPLELRLTERGVVGCGDGDYDAAAVVELAERAGWPVLAEPSSGARRGPNALVGYQYLLASPEFMAAPRPTGLLSPGRPGLTPPQSALLRLARTATPAGPVPSGPRLDAAEASTAPPVRHIV